MKTINDYNLDEKMNLLLYKIYKRECLSPYGTMLFLSVSLILIGMFLNFLPMILENIFPESINENISNNVVLTIYFSMTIASYAILFLAMLLLGLSLYQIITHKKRLQVAFQMENDGLFNEVFDISNDDIKDVKRVWQLVKKDKNKGGK